MGAEAARYQERMGQLAESYLKHVLIILEDQDTGANLRDFLDPWWVFNRESLKPSLEPQSSLVKRQRSGGYCPHTFNFPCPWFHRERVRSFDFISEDAQRVIDLGEEARVRDKKTHPLELRLIVDHVVPFAVLGPELFRNPSLRDRDQLRGFLQRHFFHAVISKEFDDKERLKAHGLANAMPAGWRFWTDDPFRRYERAGINGERLC